MKYKDFVMFGCVFVHSKPVCVECGVILTDDSMKRVKLKQCQKSMHPAFVGEDMECFENKRLIY